MLQTVSKVYVWKINIKKLKIYIFHDINYDKDTQIQESKDGGGRWEDGMWINSQLL